MNTNPATVAMLQHHLRIQRIFVNTAQGPRPLRLAITHGYRKAFPLDPRYQTVRIHRIWRARSRDISLRPKAIASVAISYGYRNPRYSRTSTFDHL